VTYRLEELADQPSLRSIVEPAVRAAERRRERR
jgi:hypothetical protein